MPDQSPRTERFIRWLIAWRWPLFGLALWRRRCATCRRSSSISTARSKTCSRPTTRSSNLTTCSNRLSAQRSRAGSLYRPAVDDAGRTGALAAVDRRARARARRGGRAELNNGPLGDEIADPDNPLSRSFLELFRGLHGRRRSPDRRGGLPARLAIRGQSGRRLSTACAQPSKPTIRPARSSASRSWWSTSFRLLDADGRRLGRVSMVLLIAVIVLLFRSLRWVIVPLAVVVVSIVVTEGIIAYSQWRLTIVSSMLSSIITIIAIATVVHLIVHFRELRARGLGPREALARTGTELAAPIFWACATDAAGFGALIAAHVEPVHDFGWMMLIGSLVVLPALVAVVPCLALAGRFDSDPRAPGAKGTWNLGLDRLEPLDRAASAAGSGRSRRC